MPVGVFKLEHTCGKDDDNGAMGCEAKAAIATESMNRALSAYDPDYGFHGAFTLSRFNSISCSSRVPNKS